MTDPRILAFAGSTRQGSHNQKLLMVAVDGARSAGADVTVISLKDFPLPLFDEELEREQGSPENATRLKQLFLKHDGLLIASPEYNSSITPLLKNTIDWVSREGEGIPGLAAYNGKSAALLSASPGALGGLRGLVHVRSILGNIGVLVLPTQVAVPRAFEAFDEQGRLKDEKKQSQVHELGRSLAATVQKLSA